MTYFAERLKNLRIQSGLSMQDLADAAKVSKSMISKIERDEVQPTIDVAGKLAKALGKTLSEMLHAAQTIQAVYLAKEEQAVWEDAQKIKRRNISPVFEGLKIEWLQVGLPPHTSIQKEELANGICEKYILVTEGILEIKIGSRVYKLNKGDSFYFDASGKHDFENNNDDDVEFYIVIKHPT